jgi:hypothetical protein
MLSGSSGLTWHRSLKTLSSQIWDAIRILKRFRFTAPGFRCLVVVASQRCIKALLVFRAAHQSHCISAQWGSLSVLLQFAMQSGMLLLQHSLVLLWRLTQSGPLAPKKPCETCPGDYSLFQWHTYCVLKTRLRRMDACVLTHIRCFFMFIPLLFTHRCPVDVGYNVACAVKYTQRTCSGCSVTDAPLTVALFSCFFVCSVLPSYDMLNDSSGPRSSLGAREG